MINLKKWDEIDVYDDALNRRRGAVISTVVNDFYQKAKGQTNVISAQEVYQLCDKFSFFSSSIWYDKYAFKSNRKIIFFTG